MQAFHLWCLNGLFQIMRALTALETAYRLPNRLFGSVFRHVVLIPEQGGSGHSYSTSQQSRRL